MRYTITVPEEMIGGRVEGRKGCVCVEVHLYGGEIRTAPVHCVQERERKKKVNKESKSNEYEDQNK